MKIKHNNLGTVNKNEVVLEKYYSNAEGGQSRAVLVLTFSYQTCVGISLVGAGEHLYGVHANDWSTTTGKLLNELEPDKKKRIPSDEFAILLEKAMAQFENVK